MDAERSSKMKLYTIMLFTLAITVFAGCVTNQQMLDKRQDDAIQTVLNRARFEMNCPEAQGSVLSREVVQPAIQAPRLGGVERLEYTIGVEGCGNRNTYVVICPEGSEGCFAADGQR